MNRTRRTRVRLRRVAALVVAVAASVSASSAQEQFSFFLSAAGSNGVVITDLRAEEVVVTENGQQGTVSRIELVTSPVKVTVLVDNGVGTGPLLTPYRNGLKALFEALPDDVEASLLTLAPQPRWVVRSTTDRAQLLQGPDRITPDNSPPKFLEGMIEAAGRIDQENRKALAYFPVIVVLSTTGVEGSGEVDRDISRMARQLTTHPARVHVVMLGTGGTSSTQFLGARQVQVGKTMADETGGRYEAIAASSRIPALLAEYGELIAAAHRFQSQQYKVTVTRPGDAKGPLGTMAVGIAREGVTVTATAQGLKP